MLVHCSNEMLVSTGTYTIGTEIDLSPVAADDTADVTYCFLLYSIHTGVRVTSM